jgi:hypothetical protein
VLVAPATRTRAGSPERSAAPLLAARSSSKVVAVFAPDDALGAIAAGLSLWLCAALSSSKVVGMAGDPA